MFFNVSTSRKTWPLDIRTMLLLFQSQSFSLPMLYMFSIYVSSHLIIFYSQYFDVFSLRREFLSFLYKIPTAV